MLKLIRVQYGKPDTPEDMREYRIDGVGPAGTIKEFKDVFPTQTFKIIDSISKKETDIKKLNKVLD